MGIQDETEEINMTIHRDILRSLAITGLVLFAPVTAMA